MFLGTGVAPQKFWKRLPKTIGNDAEKHRIIKDLERPGTDFESLRRSLFFKELALNPSNSDEIQVS